MKDWDKATADERQAEQVRRLQQARQQGPRTPLGGGGARPDRAFVERFTRMAYGGSRSSDDGTCERCGLAHPTRMCSEVRR